MNFGENTQDGLKRVAQYAYGSKDVLGKGYSSVVYRAQNETNGTPHITKVTPWPWNSSIWKISRVKSTKHSSATKWKSSDYSATSKISSNSTKSSP